MTREKRLESAIIGCLGFSGLPTNLRNIAVSALYDDKSEPYTRTVYQWRYKNAEQTHWKVAKSLLTELEAKDYYLGCDIERHAGPYEVPA